jgi:hypothetical protein
MDTIGQFNPEVNNDVIFNRNFNTYHFYNHCHHETANGNTKQAARFAVEVIP